MKLTQSGKSPLSIFLFLMGGVLIVYGQSLLANHPYNRHVGMLTLVVIGIFMVLFGIWIIEKGLPRWLARFLEWLSNHSIQEWQLGCLMLAIPTALVVPLAAGSDARMISPILSISAWLVAIGLVVAGTWVQPAPLRWPSWRQVVLFLGLTGVAFLLRVILVGQIPIMLTGDEASAGLAAEEFTRGAWNNIFITSWYAFPSFFFTLPSFFITLLGHTTEALRIPSAIAGALTVTASFFIAHAMFGKRAAWFTAVFLAAFHFHIHFSRIGLNNIWDGLWYIVTIGALWYGWEKDRRNAYLLAGLSLGISQYFYSSSRTILALILVWLILAVILDRPRLKHSLVNLVCMFLVTTVVTLPLVLHYYKFPNTFFEPMNRVALTSAWLRQQVVITGSPAWKIVLNQVGLALGSFTYAPLRAWYTPDVPLLRPLAAGLFLIGIILLLFRKTKWHIIPIMLWLLAFIVIGGLSESTPAAQRYVAAAPVCALLVGFGLSESSVVLGDIIGRRKHWITFISIVLVAILAVDELYFYFYKFTPHSAISTARSNGVIAQTLANYLETKPGDTQVLFFGSPNMGYYSVPSIQYLVPEIKGTDINDSWSPAFKLGITSRHLIFVFLPDREAQTSLVQADFPNGKLIDIPAADGKLLYTLYEVNQH